MGGLIQKNIGDIFDTLLFSANISNMEGKSFIHRSVFFHNICQFHESKLHAANIFRQILQYSTSHCFSSQNSGLFQKKIQFLVLKQFFDILWFKLLFLQCLFPKIGKQKLSWNLPGVFYFNKVGWVGMMLCLDCCYLNQGFK